MKINFGNLFRLAVKLAPAVAMLVPVVKQAARDVANEPKKPG